MIIVEGPDGSGKSTLINYLKDELGLPVAPRVVSKDAEAMVDLVEWVNINLSEGFQPTIFDRHRLISEPIYGPILRDRLDTHFGDPLWLMGKLWALRDIKPVVIYCLPPLHLVWDNVKNDPENEVVAKYWITQALWGAYMNKAATHRLDDNAEAWLYDYSAPHAGVIRRSLVRSIISRINNQEV